jgi:hypothetical protein
VERGGIKEIEGAEDEWVKKIDWKEGVVDCYDMIPPYTIYNLLGYWSKTRRLYERISVISYLRCSCTSTKPP